MVTWQNPGREAVAAASRPLLSVHLQHQKSGQSKIAPHRVM